MYFRQARSDELQSAWDSLGDLSHVIISEFPGETDLENNYVRIAIRLLREYNELLDILNTLQRRKMGIKVWYKSPYGPSGDKEFLFEQGRSFEQDVDGNLTIYDKDDKSIGYVAHGTYVQLFVEDLSGFQQDKLAKMIEQDYAGQDVPGSHSIRTSSADLAAERDMEHERLSQKDT